MIVKRPGRRENEIARMHDDALAIDGGVGALALDNGAQGTRHVAVAAGEFARQHQLQPRINALRDTRSAGEAWILEHQDTALGFARGDQLARFHQERPHLVVSPERGNSGRMRPCADDFAEHLPQGSGVQLGDPLIEVQARSSDHAGNEASVRRTSLRGSSTTSHLSSRIMVARLAGVYAGHASPFWLGLPVRAKATQAPLILAASA